jgi:uroporphyrinogen-III decarboxylase
MQTSMTSRERLLATCAHQPTDHVPLHLDVHPLYYQYDPQVVTWDDQFGRTDALLALGADAMIEVWLPDPTLHPDVKVRTWREENDSVVLLGKEYQTPAGPLRQVLKETPDLYRWNKINSKTRGRFADNLIDGVGLLEDVNPSRSVEFLVKGPEDLPKLRFLFQPLEGEQLARWREDARYARQEAQRRQVALIARRTYCGAAMVWLTDALKTMLSYDEDPDYMDEFLQIIHEWQLATLKRVLDLGDIDIVTRFGYYDIPDFWGRKYFERYLRPRIDQEGELVHQAGALLRQQQSKGVTQLVDIYKEMKADILCDIDPVQGQEDMSLLKKELGAAKTLMGGINGDLFLGNASPPEIDQAVRETLELMAPGGGFIMHIIPGIYSGVPWANVLRLVEAWKKYA